MHRLLWFVVYCCFFVFSQGLRCMSSNNSIQNIGDIMLGSARKRIEVKCQSNQVSCVISWVQLQNEVVLLGQGCSYIPDDTRKKENVHMPSTCPFGPRWTETCTTSLCNKKVKPYDFWEAENGCVPPREGDHQKKSKNNKPGQKYLNHRDVIRLVAIFVCVVTIVFFTRLVTIPAIRKTNLRKSWKIAFGGGSRKEEDDN